MSEVQAPPPLPKSQPFFGRRHSTILKLLGVGALVLILLIPLAMITGVLRERLERRNEAVANITSSWGREQNVIGPVLGVPYQYKFKTIKEIPAPDGKRHSVACSAVSGCVIAELIAKIWAITLPVTIETDPPVTSARESQGIAAIAAVAKICNDHHIVTRTAVFPAMKCNHLISVVDMMDIDVLASQTARLIEPVPPQPHQISIKSIDTGV